MKRYSLALIIVLLVSYTFLTAQSEWQSVSAAGVEFSYRVTADGENLEGIISAATTGWVSVGFNPTVQMRDANIIIAYVLDNETFIRDDWGTSNISHASDVSLGGTSDISVISGSEEGGLTSVHFVIPLDSNDQYDQPLTIGETYPIIVARGPNGANNFTSQHSAAGSAQITLQDPVSADDSSVLIKPENSLVAIAPNPFRNATNIKYSLQENTPVEISIYNLKGQLVYKTLSNQIMGEYELTWQAGKIPSGVYFMTFQTNGGIEGKRITILNR